MWQKFIRAAFRMRPSTLRNALLLQSLSPVKPRATTSRLFGTLLFTWPFATSQSSSPESVTKELFATSMQHIMSREFAQADEVLHKLLKHLYEAREQGQIEEAAYISQRARVCSEMSNVNLMLGQYEAAEKLLKQVLQDCVAADVPTTDVMFVELSLKLALIYEKLGRTQEATHGFRYCIQTQEDKLNNYAEEDDTPEYMNEKALLGMSYNYYSKFLFSQGQNELALKYAEKSLRLANQIYSPDHPNCLNLMCDIAVIQAQRHQFEKAGTMLENAITQARDNFNQVRNKMNSDEQLSEADTLGTCLIHALLQRASVESLSGRRHSAIKSIQEAESVLPHLTNSDNDRKKIDDFKSTFVL